MSPDPEALHRDRPAHSPIAVRCPHCGAPLEVPDERAQLVVCTRCDSRCELTGPQRDTLALLGEGNSRGPGAYELSLGRPFRWKGARFEVVARMLWVEEGDPEYSTRVYVLYHPRRPLLFLDEYKGSWGLTWKTHAHPVGDPRGVSAGGMIRFHDGRKLRCQEMVIRELWHVDGCLPWMAEIGDEVVAWELSGDHREVAEIERTPGELEVNEGLRLTTEQLKSAMPDLDIEVKAPPAAPWVRKAQALATAAIGLAGLVFTGVIALSAGSTGTLVHSERFGPAALTAEAWSQPFELSGEGLITIDLDSTVSNAWMYAELALVRGDDAVVHVTDADISYYHGSSGGESWSEGSQRERIWLRGGQPGTHHLYLRAVSASGESPSATSAHHSLSVQVYEGRHRPYFAPLGLLTGIVFLALGLLRFKMISEEE